MTLNIKNLTILIVSFKSEKVIHNCIQSINNKIDIIVIDNSNDINFKKLLEEKYHNVKCILSSQNIGMGSANNLGIKNIDKDYAFIINPDVIFKNNTINELIHSSKSLDNFAILAPLSDNENYPNYLLDKNKETKINFDLPFEVKSVDGYAMLLNLKKLKKLEGFKFFDENIFLYMENDDMCEELIKRNEKIYIVPSSKVHHLGGKGVDSKFSNEIELSRNWHWMWSKFYFNKKHYGYFIAVKKTLGNFISAISKITYYFITLNNYKRKIYQMRLSGLFNSMLGRKSSFRPKFYN